MPAITIQNLSEETHQVLKRRAAAKGLSTEAEICSILDEVAHLENRLKLGDALAAFGKKLGGLELDTTRDSTPAEPADFE